MSAFVDWVAAIAAAVIPGWGSDGAPHYNGYAEGDYVYAAPAAAGRIAQIAVVEGGQVQKGDLLFQLEDSQQIAALNAARANAAVAQANLENLSTGSRQPEIAVIRATLDQARADQTLAASTLARSKQLRASGAVSQAKVDVDQASYDSASAHVAQLEAQLKVAELPARDAQRIAAEASHTAALAQEEGAKSALKDRTVDAPVGGLVDKVYYDAGEVAGAGAPVVSILPPGALKALFFVPEPDRAQIKLGEEFNVSCAGCASGITAKVTRMASSPQYTPPIIYSREESARLVFRVEARVQNPQGLLPGQPLTLSAKP
ncbi:HlyD family secretion protein [Thioclava sp.]|uniref:HlyD family secretion protein n=1 Tax=Thioclava sp. TaxID=1933450 RepID=UPI003AA920E1